MSADPEAIRQANAIHSSQRGRTIDERAWELQEAAEALLAGVAHLRALPTAAAAEAITWQLWGMSRAAGALADALARKGGACSPS